MRERETERQKEGETEKERKRLKKVLFYVGHGKYNDYMSTEEVQKIKAKLEILFSNY